MARSSAQTRPRARRHATTQPQQQREGWEGPDATKDDPRGQGRVCPCVSAATHERPAPPQGFAREDGSSGITAGKITSHQSRSSDTHAHTCERFCLVSRGQSNICGRHKSEGRREMEIPFVSRQVGSTRALSSIPTGHSSKHVKEQRSSNTPEAEFGPFRQTFRSDLLLWKR